MWQRILPTVILLAGLFLLTAGHSSSQSTAWTGVTCAVPTSGFAHYAKDPISGLCVPIITVPAANAPVGCPTNAQGIFLQHSSGECEQVNVFAGANGVAATVVAASFVDSSGNPIAFLPGGSPPIAYMNIVVVAP